MTVNLEKLDKPTTVKIGSGTKVELEELSQLMTARLGVRVSMAAALRFIIGEALKKERQDAVAV